MVVRRLSTSIKRDKRDNYIFKAIILHHILVCYILFLINLVNYFLFNFLKYSYIIVDGFGISLNVLIAFSIWRWVSRDRRSLAGVRMKVKHYFLQFFVRLCGYGYVTGLVILILCLCPCFPGWTGSLISMLITLTLPLAGSVGLIPHFFFTTVLVGLAGALGSSFKAWIIYYLMLIPSIVAQSIIVIKFFNSLSRNDRKHLVFKFALFHHLVIGFGSYFFVHLISLPFWYVYSLVINLVIAIAILGWINERSD
jgi:hypothetical protein